MLLRRKRITSRDGNKGFGEMKKSNMFPIGGYRTNECMDEKKDKKVEMCSLAGAFKVRSSSSSSSRDWVWLI